MKKRYVLIGLIVLVVVGVGFFTMTSVGQLIFAFAVEEVTRDPLIKRIEADVARQDTRWGVQIDHNTNVFGNELDRISVVNRLLESEFSPATKLEPYYENEKIGDFDYGTDLYEALISGLPCQKKFYIFLWFDDEDILTIAKSAQFEAGCL